MFPAQTPFGIGTVVRLCVAKSILSTTVPAATQSAPNATAACHGWPLRPIGSPSFAEFGSNGVRVALVASNNHSSEPAATRSKGRSDTVNFFVR